MMAERFYEGVERGDLDVVREILRGHPEIVNQQRQGDGERLVLHIAVLRRDAAMTRLLMEYGADARIGIWPYRTATAAIVLAAEHGYDEIANVIQEVESPRIPDAPPEIDPAIEAVQRGDLEWLRGRHAEGNLLPSDGLLGAAVQHDRPEILASLLDWGFDPNRDEALQECTISGRLAMAEMMLARGADANAWACVWNAYRQRDAAMIGLLARYGGVPNAATPGYLRDTELAARMFADEAAGRLPKGTVREGHTVAEEVVDPAASAGATEILRMALERINWAPNDRRWFGILASPLCFRNHIPWIYSEKWDLDRSTYIDCFALVLERCHANVCGRYGMTILHYAAASYDWITPAERLAFVSMLLDHGARTDVRDELLRKTPPGWARRWGRTEVADLLVSRGAD